MQLVLRFAILTVLSVLCLMPATAQEKTDPGSAKPGKNNETTQKTEDKSSKSDDEQGIEFPVVEDWERGSVQNYPDPALGSSVTYQSEEGGRVTIYVYNRGLSRIPDGIGDKTIKEEIDRAKSEIVQIGKAGIYEDVKELKSDTVTLGGANGKVKSLRSLFYFKVKGAEMDSEIYLFGYQNNFIKIRATRPKSETGAENKAFATLLAEIDKIFAK